MSRLDDQIMANLQQFNEDAERIRNMEQELPGMGISVSASEATKREAIRELYDKHSKRYEELAAAKRKEVADNLQTARQQLFRYRTGMGIDVVEISVSTRDALERLAGITSPQELRDRLADAHELGDTIMARCILRKAVELGEDFGGGAIVQDYLNRYPGQRDAYNTLESASLEADRIAQWGISGSIPNPEDAGLSFSSPGGGLIPDTMTTQQAPEGQ
jgi:hypothetical protein